MKKIKLSPSIKSPSKGHVVECLLDKCQSSKLSEKRQGLVDLHAYFMKNESFPPQFIDRIGTTFCEIFQEDLDALKGMRSLFLDILNPFLLSHGKNLIDLENIFSILFHRALIGLNCINSELDTQISVKLTKTFEILTDLMTPDSLSLAVLHYLEKEQGQMSTQTLKIFILTTLTSILSPSKGKIKKIRVIQVFTEIKVPKLQLLVQTILDWAASTDSSEEIKDKCEIVFCLLLDKVTPQMTLVWSLMDSQGQDQATTVLRSHMIKQLWALAETVNERGARKVTPEKVAPPVLELSTNDEKTDPMTPHEEIEDEDDLYRTTLNQLEIDSDSLDESDRIELVKKLDIFIDELSLDDQFSRVCQYLLTPICSNPTSSFKVFALVHLRYLICSFSRESLEPDLEELVYLLPKLLNFCGRINTSQEIRDKARGIIHILFTQDTGLFLQVPNLIQTQIKLVLGTHQSLGLNN